MRFGMFDPNHREYVITDPKTPVKWINYLGTRRFGGYIDHTGGALICRNDPTFGRITRYIQQLPASEFQGTGIYVRLQQTEGYRLYSPFYVPTLTELDRFECRVGLGYSHFLAEFNALRTEITVFVPPHELCLVWQFRIENVGEKEAVVDAIPIVDYSHPDALQQLTNADWVPQTMQSRARWQEDRLFLLQYPYMRRDSCVNYLVSTWPVDSFETDRQIFLGKNGYGTFRQPQSLISSHLNNTEARRGDNVGALLLRLGRLEPGQFHSFTLQLGQAENLEQAQAAFQRFRQPAQVEAALQELKAFWDEYLSAQQFETPDGNMNLMLNIRNPHQCYVTKTWSRYLSTYQPGLGARAIGYRDSMQDALAVLPGAAGEVKPLLAWLLSFQKTDGSAMHQFNPLTRVGSEGDSLEMEDRPHYYSDDHLWGILAVTAYLKETGDMGFLHQEVPFYTHPEKKDEAEVGTIRQHLQRGLDFTRRNTGQHGLPLLGFADWNDTVNLPSGAESLFTANLYGAALQEMIQLLDFLDELEAAAGYRVDYEQMKAAFQRVAWDGEWFRRYFDAQGRPLGSAQNTHGQIYLNAQSWAVLSGFAEREQARIAMQSVHERLNTRYGLKLSHPGYDGYDPEVGGVTTYPPGAKENGGIFVHPNPWAMMAETIMGDGDRAYQYYAQINPVLKNEQIEIYECEPYVYAQNILGPEHPQFGLARNSWLTGAAAWCYQAATQWILGIRPDYKGLRIDPCIPAGWAGFSVRRRFRGTMLDIEICNPSSVCHGVEVITVDGEPIDGCLIPLHLMSSHTSVKVRLGHASEPSLQGDMPLL
ncbi:MAG: hypothetical protein PVF49_02855 [Anaerolineales bacterium]|jgi:cellobiose phosphorylase